MIKSPSGENASIKTLFLFNCLCIVCRFEGNLFKKKKRRPAGGRVFVLRLVYTVREHTMTRVDTCQE